MSEIKRNLMLWAVGHDRGPVPELDGPRVVVLENPDHLAATEASNLVGPGTTVFLPTASTETGQPHRAPSGATLVGFEGSPSGPGEEIVLGSHFVLQTIKYAIGEYISMTGPIVARIEDDEDLEVFAEDADRARTSGVFPDFAVSPLAQIADISALGAPQDRSGPQHRLHVRANGEVTISAAGARLGTLEDPLSTLTAAWVDANEASQVPCAVSLGDRLSEAERIEVVAMRPWLRGYFNALHALRHAAARGFTGVRVSGFGENLAPTGPALESSIDAANEAIVLWNDEQALVCDSTTDRVISMGIPAGQLTDLLLRCGSVEQAAEFAPQKALETVHGHLRERGLVVTGGDRS